MYWLSSQTPESVNNMNKTVLNMNNKSGACNFLVVDGLIYSLLSGIMIYLSQAAFALLSVNRLKLYRIDLVPLDWTRQCRGCWAIWLFRRSMGGCSRLWSGLYWHAFHPIEILTWMGVHIKSCVCYSRNNWLSYWSPLLRWAVGDGIYGVVLVGLFSGQRSWFHNVFKL